MATIIAVLVPLGPGIAGRVFDQFGDYRYAFFSAAVFALIALAFLLAVPGPRHPLLVAAVAGTAVASLALGAGLRLAERRSARRARRRERSRYLAHLAQVAAAADQLASAQLAAADHLHPDPPRLWTLVCRAERLWELGYRLGQGFNFARPLPAHEVGRLLTAPTVPWMVSGCTCAPQSGQTVTPILANSKRR